jgi:hypothetical protein
MVGITAGGLGAASASGDADADNYWGCDGIISLDVGACVSNPVPSELPSAPAPPAL